MNRLQSELRRLYLPPQLDGQPADPDNPSLIDARGRVRALVLQLARPADWTALSKVWQGVQADLGWPAPAIAISGDDAFQLWFSLREPVPAPEAALCLESLRLRYLAEIPAQRVVSMPSIEAVSPNQTLHAALVPAPQGTSGRWSAFVAPDLAPVFAEEPWLDLPPNPEGQCDLLSRLRSIPPDEFLQALEQLRPQRAAQSGGSASMAAAGVSQGPEPSEPGQDPMRFLQAIMNDGGVELSLRIEAAKALLAYAHDRRPR